MINRGSETNKFLARSVGLPIRASYGQRVVTNGLIACFSRAFFLRQLTFFGSAGASQLWLYGGVAFNSSGSQIRTNQLFRAIWSDTYVCFVMMFVSMVLIWNANFV